MHPRGAGDLIAAEIAAARDLGMRFHPTRGSMSLSEKDGGLPPDSVVQDDDEILADSERLVAAFHDRSPSAMTRIALAPCSPFSVSTALMTRTAELAERLDVRLHTHLCETEDENEFCLEQFGRRPVDYLADVGWLTDRTWLAHVVWPDAGGGGRLGAARVGAAHCPSCDMILGSGLAPVAELRAAGTPVGLGVDGSASADSASMWLEARTAMLRASCATVRPRCRRRDALEIATRGGAACLGRDRRDRRAVDRGVRRPGGLALWTASGSRARCPTRSRRGCAAGRPRRGTPWSAGRSVVDGRRPGARRPRRAARRPSAGLGAAPGLTPGRPYGWLPAILALRSVSRP